MKTPGARLREAWSAGPIMIPGAFNALVAKQAERLGFAAVYFSGGRAFGGLGGPAGHRAAHPDRVCRAGGGAGSRDVAAGSLRCGYRVSARHLTSSGRFGCTRRPVWPACIWKTRPYPSGAGT